MIEMHRRVNPCGACFIMLKIDKQKSDNYQYFIRIGNCLTLFLVELYLPPVTALILASTSFSEMPYISEMSSTFSLYSELLLYS